MSEVSIKRDQRANFCNANLKEAVICAATKPLVVDCSYVVPAFTQETNADCSNVLINLDPHDSTGTGITRSRAASAPYARAAKMSSCFKAGY